MARPIFHDTTPVVSGTATYPLYALISDWRLRQIFYRASRDLGDEFAVPAPRQPELSGGAAEQPETAEMER